MYELLAANPWIIFMTLVMQIPICGIVFGTITTYLQKTHQAELDASLKHAMLERGMSAEEIKTVLEAGVSRPSLKRRCHAASAHAERSEAV